MNNVKANKPGGAIRRKKASPKLVGAVNYRPAAVCAHLSWTSSLAAAEADCGAEVRGVQKDGTASEGAVEVVSAALGPEVSRAEETA